MKIHSNGSKWAGEEPDSVEKLISVLEKQTLDPSFETCGRHFYRNEEGEFCAFGNFLTVSHVFRINGTLEEMLPLAKAIKSARRRKDYLTALNAT